MAGVRENIIMIMRNENTVTKYVFLTIIFFEEELNSNFMLLAYAFREDKFYN